jgi:hypothetical protein
LWQPDPVLKIEEELVDVTPSPVLIWLEGLHDRVAGRMEMLGGMRILRLVTAANMSAFKADSQVYPGVTDFQAILAPISTLCYLSYLIKVTTLLSHRSLSPFKYFYSCV